MNKNVVRWAGAGVALTAVALLAGCAVTRIEQGRQLAKAATPFSTHPAGATARLLIVGDSTAVGVGATSPATSVAGRLAASMPRLAITNLGVNGARFSDAAEQLLHTPDPRYDVVLVMAGGNDVIFMSSEATLRAAIERTAEQAKVLAPRVIFLPPGNAGNAPFFFAPLSWLMTARSRSLHAMVSEAAMRSGASYVNLYKEKAEDPFAQEPQRMHSADGLHPSDDGYALWTQELLRQSPIADALSGSRPGR
ncbi:MAG: GDSL-type esterase/lipase family protein [Betaproteobacteria bacterium]